jgi:hypothetical protein
LKIEKDLEKDFPILQNLIYLVRKSQIEIVVSSIFPIDERKTFLLSALASKKRLNKKNNYTSSYYVGIFNIIKCHYFFDSTTV